jgi:hypothetical protein
MAKKYYDEDITLKTDWGGDDTTGNLPVSGGKVQKVIKEGINSKVGYVGYVENKKSGQGFYVLTRDEDVFNKYRGTITEEKPWGDINMDGVDGRRFDAPFNYKMNITLLNPESGYKSTLAGSTGNVIKFKAETLDSNNTPQGESMTITFKVKTEGGVESTYTAIYDGNIASQGIEYNLDGKLGTGINTITITAVGMNTGISAMRRITYRSIDMYFTDKFNISTPYQFTNEGTLAINVGYDLKGVGKTTIIWCFDGNHYETDELANLNPNLSNKSRVFYFTETPNTWLKPGVHNIQMSMVCKDNDSGEEFQTPIYYREFIVETTPTRLSTPYLVRKTSFDSAKGFLEYGETPTIYNAKQFENVEIEYAAYYNGKGTCNVTTYIKYNGDDMMEVASENLPIVSAGFSDVQKRLINLVKDGSAEVILRSYYKETECFETTIQLEIAPSDMKINTVIEDVVLDLNAFGRSNNASGKDKWEYNYIDVYGKQQTIKTTFSKNEYAIISTYDENNKVIAPDDANETNSIYVDELPKVENDEVKYLIYDNDYYVWNREFDWSDTSGWSDNKLKLANGNAITINYQPFLDTKTIKKRGATFEFEFETTNVYNDDAIICRICGNKNFAPGIVISASGAELVISPDTVTEGENAGYTKKVSTKYKAEENNRIAFVITPDDDDEKYRNRILSIYVNGELCGAYAYERGTSFYNESNISFRGSEDACVNISSIKIYERALTSNEILSNYIYYRNNADEKAKIYKRNDIMVSDEDIFDSDKLKSQLPVMMIYQTNENQSIDDIHQEKENKKLTRFFDVVYIDIQNPSKNFLVKNAYVTPQGTSSMNYPVKNLRLYTGKKNDAGEYYSKLYVGSNIFKDGSPSNLNDENINPETEVDGKRLYAFKDGSIPVNCWCLKADFAESSSSHNTGTSRYWNQVLKNAGFLTKAQVKAAKHKWGETLKNGEVREYDVRTAIDGFPIVVFYQAINEAPRFEGKYNFNNDKSTEDVFGFTGGIEIKDQEVKYFYIGKKRPIIHKDAEAVSDGYTDTPTTDSPLYASKILASYEKEVIDPETGEKFFEKIPTDEDWYMLRGKELLDNPKMECWELLNSYNEVALFTTMDGFCPGDGDKKMGYMDDKGVFHEAFESRYPDCGGYFHYNSLQRFGEWLVSCRYLDVDDETGQSVPFAQASLPSENYHKNDNKLSICSLTKQTGKFEFNFPGYNFYQEIDEPTNIIQDGYQQISIDSEVLETLEFIEVESILNITKIEGYEYVKCGELYYTWMPGNVLKATEIPSVHESSYDYVLVGGKYYVWANTYNFEDYHITQWVDDSAFNRALKFAVEKYDHIEMDKMAAYYIYLMRFGGVDQTVKNAMLTTEGPATEDANSKLPSLWYFINYDNDTILGVKNDGRLVFDPYITRETKDGPTTYAYAGRTSTLWNNLEADAQFMAKVTEVDNKLAEGGADPLFSLSYANALREYDKNQSDKWCERIYNKDAERKYIDTYVNGWTQKIAGSNEPDNHVFEDYLYDVHGSRSAHRKWWLGRRFNVFDSRFCNTNFRNQLIKLRSSNLPAGSSFTITSGEPIFYAWGLDNSVTEMTPTVLKPGNTHTFTTNSAINIGSFLRIMGAANISVLDLRKCVGAITELDITGCYSPLVGTKMKEILVGDHNRDDIKNVSNGNLKFSGLANASKLEVLDITNIQNAMSLDGLSSLLNIREVYAKGTSISNFTFADGAMIEKIELPSTVETLSLTRSSSIKYDNIIFDGDGYGKLTRLEIDNCANLMNNADFVINWIGSKTTAQRNNLSLDLQGINWKFGINDYANLFLLEDVGTSVMAQRNIGGTIEITTTLNINDIVKLKSIFGDECFKEGSQVYIKAPTGIYVDVPSIVWEGDSKVKCEITTVGTTLKGDLSLTATVSEIVDGESVIKVIGATKGVITMDESNISKGYVLLSVLESDNVYENFVLKALYRDETGFERQGTGGAVISKRLYPNGITVTTAKDSYNNKTKNALSIVYSPDNINDLNLDGRGKFNVTWEMINGSVGYNNSLELHDADKETAYIQAPNGFDGTVVVKATIFRKYDDAELCSATKEIEFTNPDTIITKLSNEPLYNILVSNKIIDDKTGFGKLTKTDASALTMDRLIDASGKSIFAGNTELESFLEFQYFDNVAMGQMPQTGVVATLTPDGMFKGCTKLKEIAFSANFQYTGEGGTGFDDRTSAGMFEGCTNLEHIYGPHVSNDEYGNPEYTNLSFVHVCKNFAKGCVKLQTCLLSSATKYIGGRAFDGCKLLDYFQLATSPDTEIYCDSTYSAFQGCENITFYGAEYGGVTTAKYQVKDGACYEVNGNELKLIHMGKDSLVENIPTNIPVVAASYSMEYRKENDIVVPSNVIFNGNRIFNESVGNSVTLTRVIGDNADNCKYLFSKTNYKGNYCFANGETIIPSRCFADVTDIATYQIAEGINTIKSGAFYGASALESIVFPSSLREIEAQVFWLSNLKTLTFKGDEPPILKNDLLYGIMPDAIYVYPKNYDAYKNGDTLLHLLVPFVKPIKLYNEGYVRFIKDGKIYFGEDGKTISLGSGASFTDTVYDYMKYSTEQDVYDLNVYIDGEVVGEIAGEYTTIYLGDNHSLFSGDGYNFQHGVYNDEVIPILKDSGWIYDKRFHGVRSNSNVDENDATEITLNLPNFSGVETTLKHGLYSELDSKQTKGYSYVKDSTNDTLLKNTERGYNITSVITSPDGVFTLGYVGNSTKTGINGMVLHSIGNSVYSDPQPTNIPLLTLDEGETKTVAINLNAPVVIPNSVYVTLTDNKAHTYRQLWNGETLYFTIPNTNDFVLSASNFVDENGKAFFAEPSIIIADTIIDLEFTSKSGLELQDNILSVYTDTYDWHLDISACNGIWSEVNELVEYVTVDEILISDANGLVNTKLMANSDENSIFAQALKHDKFENGIVGYIPSFIEIEMFKDNLTEINEFLIQKGKPTISLDNIWTSEAYNANDAWTSDGKVVSKQTELNYYIFGKRIIL